MNAVQARLQWRAANGRKHIAEKALNAMKEKILRMEKEMKKDRLFMKEKDHVYGMASNC